MTWTLTILMIQIIAGLVGGHFAAVATHEHSFGAVGHTVAGSVGGFLSGYFLQTLAVTMVTSTGSLNEPRSAEVFMVQALTGLAFWGDRDDGRRVYQAHHRPSAVIRRRRSAAK
jgi:uncharacterized membrane protein YeaQ/YmgE (transglycosylase-associated protein family)